MSEYMVDVGLNLQAGDYVTTMGQAINLTKQYSDVATGLPGAVQNLSKSMVNATLAVTGFNKINSVALDTAAAYQKQLSGVDAKATAAGQSFTQLAKTTKSWAREFPIGMGEATRVMETLQQQGIKSERQMASLGKSFIKLGEATGTSASGMGAEFLQLSRTFGNGISQFQKLSDSLVTTTAKMGGSAPAVVAFSKALAPVAATVGLSQTAVIGLSSAMSKLGEDGYQAANSFNKVLLDMNRAVRDGGPELKAYADLIGTTSDRLKDMFKTDPAEVLAKFSDAVAKAGPNVSRSLDALGFDSVRTTRSLTALARSGGPRAAIDTAVSSYGDGSTERAAAAAVSGLTDQATKLQETMTQVVSDVGQPMLGFAKGLLMPANAVASGLQTVTSSAPGQAVLGVGGIGGTVAGMAGTVVTAATFASLGKMAFDWFKKSSFVTGFSSGAADARAGLSRPSSPGMGSTLGFARQAGMMGLYGMGAGDGSTGLGRTANRLAGFATEGLARYQWAGANMLNNLLPKGLQSTMGVTPEMAALRTDMKASLKDLGAAAKNVDTAGMRSAAGLLRGQMGAYLRTADVGAARGVANLAASSAFLPARAAVGLAAGGVRAIGGLAGALGMTPAGLGVMAGVVGGGALVSYGMGKQRETDAARNTSRDLNTDVYSRFNSFAEATGQAGRGIVSFTAQVEQSTQRIIQANKTFTDAYSLSSQESTLAAGGGYKSVVDFMGDKKTAQSMATNIMSTLGPTASPADIARALTDVQKQDPGQYKAVADILRKTYGDQGSANAGLDYSALATDVNANKTVWDDVFKHTGLPGMPGIPATWQQVNSQQVNIGSQAVSYAGMRGAQMAEKYGGTLKYNGGEIGADEATRLLEAKRLFTTSNAENMSPETQKALTGTISDILGMSEDRANKAGLGTGFFETGAFARNIMGVPGTETQMTGDQAFQAFLDRNPDYAAKYSALQSSGSSITNSGAITLSGQFATALPDAQKSMMDYFKSFKTTAGVTSDLGNAMSDLTDVVLTQENALRNTEPGKQPGANQLGAGDAALLSYSQDQSSEQKRQSAIDSVIQRLVKASGGSFATATTAAQYAQAQAADGTAAKQVLTGVLEQLGIKQGVAQAGRSGIYDLMDQYRAGQQAQAAPANSNTSSVSTALILGGQQAQAQLFSQFADFNRAYGGLQTSEEQARRSAGISAGQISRQSQVAQSRAVEDYQLNRRYQREDFTVTRERATRDYTRSRERATADFDLSQVRAQEDYGIARNRAIVEFNKQATRMDADYNLQRSRMDEDYNKGRVRAQRDYDTSVLRANRDFELSQSRATDDFQRNQLRATEDYNKARSRMVEDYNKQISRMIEDSAKQMYDPFKRIQAQMVMDAGQLVSNLKDQTRAIQDQVDNLAKARGMGLSEAAIKSLNLADASNAQQLNRLVSDIAGNKDLASQINDAVAAKNQSAGQLVQDAGNTSFQRMADDFNTALKRSAEDFATASSRASDDFSISMGRAVTDFGTQMTDAAKDFGVQMADSEVDFKTASDRMEADFQKASERMRQDFATQLDYMEADFQKMSERARVDFDKEMGRAAQDFKTQMDDMQFDFTKMEKRAAEALKRAISRMKEDAAIAIAGIGAQTENSIKSMEESFFGMGQNSSTSLDAAKEFIKIIENAKVPVSLMKDDIQAMYKAAMDLVNGPDEADRAGWRHSANSTTPEVTDESQKAGINPANRVAEKVTGFSWTAVWEKVKSNIAKAFDWASVGANWGHAIGKALEAVAAVPVVVTVALVKAAIAIKDFFVKLPDDLKAVAEALVGWFANLADTIIATIENIPHAIVQTFANIVSTLDTAFSAAEAWLRGLAHRVSVFVSGAWDGLTAEIPEAKDVKDKVVSVFDSVKNWLSNLGGSKGYIATWVADSWDTLWKLLPTPDQMLAKVTEVFEGGKTNAKTWLNNLAEWVGKNIPDVTSFVKALDPMVEAFRQVFENIVDLYNKLDLKIDFSWKGFDIPAVGQIKVGDKTIFPGFGGATGLGAFSVNIPDLFPDVPNPFVKQSNHAMGGIVTQATRALIGEAGYPEAVIPLNQRGADVLAATMARYVDRATVQASGMERYASPVTNYVSNNHDYSTQFNGQITVQTQNPDDLAQKLQARARRQALAQPIRGSR